MAPSIDIRQADLASLEAALALLVRFFREEGFDAPQERMRESLRAVIQGPDSAVFLAWQDGQATGVATVTSTVGLEYGRSAELEDLYVLPAARGGGIAPGLIAAVCDWCRAAGCTTVQVIVTPEGQAAHNLVDYYQRRGFVHTGRVVLECRL